MQVLSVEIREVNTAIKELMENDYKLGITYRMVISLQGITFVRAVHLMIPTENFTRFDKPKNLPILPVQSLLNKPREAA